MIYVTGDTHGEQGRFTQPFIDGLLSLGDYLIVCGDFGFIFNNDQYEADFIDYLTKKPYMILWVDGNHENFDALYQYPTEIWNGGKVHRIRDNVLHLMRGQIFNIEGKTFFTMGGAYSIDKAYREEKISWWSQEQPDNSEYNEAIANLENTGKKVDYILTHQMPTTMIIKHGKYPDVHDMELCGFLDWIYYEVEFKHWYCGHWHDDKNLTDKFTMLWFDMVEIK